MSESEPREQEGSRLAGWKAEILRRVLTKKCPQCGRGRLFRGYARLEPECSECGLVYRREQGAMTGSMYLSAAVTEVFAAAVVLAGFWLTDWSLTTFLALALPVLALFTFLFLPRSMALWVAIEYMTDVANRESWAHPRS